MTRLVLQALPGRGRMLRVVTVGWRARNRMSVDGAQSASARNSTSVGMAKYRKSLSQCTELSLMELRPSFCKEAERMVCTVNGRSWGEITAVMIPQTLWDGWYPGDLQFGRVHWQTMGEHHHRNPCMSILHNRTHGCSQGMWQLEGELGKWQCQNSRKVWCIIWISEERSGGSVKMQRAVRVSDQNLTNTTSCTVNERYPFESK